MSTFGGKLEEIPDISVDRFDNDNLDSLAYFLSHCHSDHMVGLNVKVFQDSILQENKFLYTSDVSSVILKRMYPTIQNNIKILDMYKPTIIMLRDKAISVTPISAGHCPGSVMFLFENDTLILYTGDYRIHKNDIRKIKSFYDSMNKIKKIEKIYLDTTFFLKSYFSFPRRGDSLNEICKVIKEWIVKSTNHVIHLITSAKYGYEYVFNEIYKKIGMPVHVGYDVYHTYSIIPEMDDSVTVNNDSTQIHSNCGYTYQSICPKSYGKEIKLIKVSAYRWTQDNLEGGLSSLQYNVHYICYSTHASYEEGVELIKLLKPKSIEPCVKHDDPYINVEMMQLLDECLIKFKNEQKKDDSPKVFAINPTRVIDNDSDSNLSPLDYDILNSPPRENRDDLKRFLRKHSSSFVLDQKCESLKIGAPSDEFNFEHEFGFDSCSSKTVENVICKNESQMSIVTPKLSKEVLELCDVKTKENTSEEHIENVEENLLEGERDAFSEWFNASPDKEEFEKDIRSNISNTSTNVRDIEKCEVQVHTSNNTSSNSNANENIGSGSDLLNDIYFLRPTPPENEKVDETKTNGEDELIDSGGNGNEPVSNSWVFDLSPMNETDILNSSPSTTNVLEDEICAGISSKKQGEDNVNFVLDIFDTTSDISINLSSDSGAKNDKRAINKIDCPPRKKPR